MAKSLLFLPDISGYTKFIQTTEVEHSQHVISELLEILIAANTEDLKLAEIEGDALFFYKEGEIPSQERLLAQIEAMFTAFYSHLELLKKNRICPCQACATAPNLELKIIAHAGTLQHIEVQGNRKPFGQQVIEAHRLMKNSVASNNYALISRALALEIQLSQYYSSKLFRFRKGKDTYDDKELEYLYSNIDKDQLQLVQFTGIKEVKFDRPPDLALTKEFPLSAPDLMEYITNYAFRNEWSKGVDRFEYKPTEVTRKGTEHICVIDGKHFNFTAVTKPAEDDQLVYGELTTDIPFTDKTYQFFVITPLTKGASSLKLELFWEVRSPLKKLLLVLIGKRSFQKNLSAAMHGLHGFVSGK
ncbi:MAG: DUF2652 domain-containing protein [Bacteroidota bacterium]